MMDAEVKGDRVDSGWGSMARFQDGGLEAVAKISISLKLCLEPYLKQQNIFYAPHMVIGLWCHVGIISWGAVNKTIPNMTVNTAATQNCELVGAGRGLGVELTWPRWHAFRSQSSDSI